METIKKYYKKYEEIIKYLIFGVLTTIVNFVTYYILVFLCRTEAGVIGIVCNVTATIVSIFFAYVTNRKFVFKSKITGKKEVFKEMFSFFSCRAFSFFMDFLIYLIGCTIMKLPSFIVKMVSQVVVTILNYIFSKLIIFKNKK
ncbi:MAG: GtrA family protein [Clostridia bacterium]